MLTIAYEEENSGVIDVTEFSFHSVKFNQSVRLTNGLFEIFRKIRSEFVTLTYFQDFRMCLKLMNFQNVFKINIRDLRCFYCLL